MSCFRWLQIAGSKGNYTIGDRNATPGWLDWAKGALVGKSVIDLLPTLTSTSGMKGPGGFDGAPTRGARPGGAGGGRGGAFVAPGFGAQSTNPGSHSAFEGPALQGSGLSIMRRHVAEIYHTVAADVCMWDILGKAVNRPIYKILRWYADSNT